MLLVVKEEEAKAAMVRLEMTEQHLLDAILVIIFVICRGRKREECVGLGLGLGLGSGGC